MIAGWYYRDGQWVAETRKFGFDLNEPYIHPDCDPVGLPLHPFTGQPAEEALGVAYASV